MGSSSGISTWKSGSLRALFVFLMCLVLEGCGLCGGDSLRTSSLVGLSSTALGKKGLALVTGGVFLREWVYLLTGRQVPLFPAGTSSDSDRI